MIKDDLKQYRSIVAEIKELNKNIRDNTVHDTVKGSDKDYPYTQHTMSVKGATRECETDIQRCSQLKKQRDEIMRFVDSISDSLVRRIIRYKYIDGKEDVQWIDVVKKMYPNLRTDKQFKMKESLRKKCDRFLEKI